MKNVLITGANTGIGFETAKQMATLGYFVYLGSRNQDKGLKAVSKLKESGLANVALLVIDIADINSVKRARKELESIIDVLDILINNAAISGEQPQNFSTGGMENLRKIFDINFFGTIQTTQEFIPLLRNSIRPIILNVASEVGSLTMNSSAARNPNYNNYSAYGASKTAVNAFTLMLSHEPENKHLIVNSVTPGFTATALNNFTGTRSVSEGAASIVKAATRTDVTGKFFRDDNEIPW